MIVVAPLSPAGGRSRHYPFVPYQSSPSCSHFALSHTLETLINFLTRSLSLSPVQFQSEQTNLIREILPAIIRGFL